MIFLIGQSQRNVVSRRRRSCGYEQSNGGRRFGSNILTFVSIVIFASMPSWSAHAADLTVNTSNAPSAPTMRLYPVDTAGRAGGLPSRERLVRALGSG
jgi:hypothetical protein